MNNMFDPPTEGIEQKVADIRQLREQMTPFRKKPGFPYKREYPQIFFDLCDKGCTLTEISRIMQIPEERFKKWAKDKRKKSFKRAYEAGIIACHCWYIQTLKIMSIGGSPGPALEGIKSVLKAYYPERWNVQVQKSSDIKDELKQLLDAELNKDLGYKLQNPNLKPLLRQILNKRPDDIK